MYDVPDMDVDNVDVDDNNVEKNSRLPNTTKISHGISDKCMNCFHTIPDLSKSYFLPVDYKSQTIKITHSNKRKTEQTIQTEKSYKNAGVLKEEANFSAYGTFCTPHCVLSYSDRYYPTNNTMKMLICQLFFEEECSNGRPPLFAPSVNLLKGFGGSLSIDEFREIKVVTNGDFNFCDINDDDLDDDAKSIQDKIKLADSLKYKCTIKRVGREHLV